MHKVHFVVWGSIFLLAGVFVYSVEHLIAYYLWILELQAFSVGGGYHSHRGLPASLLDRFSMVSICISVILFVVAARRRPRGTRW